MLKFQSIVSRVEAETLHVRKQKSRYKKTRELWTYDSETDGFHNCQDVLCPKCHGIGRIPKPFIHGLYNGDTEEYLEFETIEEFVAFISQRKALVYAHNGGKYDYHPLRPHMNTDQPIMLINGRISRFHIGEAEFRDSLNIFPNTRLSDFGVKNEMDYEKMEPELREIPVIKREISLYLRQDCVGLWDQVSRYRREFGKSLTQAGASMKYWEKKHRHQKAPRQTHHQFQQCRPYYHGGRVQCFESGVKSVHFKMADINSAYPRAMLEEHPISPMPSVSRHLPRDTKVLQTALIRLRCTARGCFPWRAESGELYFPEDESLGTPQLREYHITGWEFLAALECDAIANIQIKEVLTFAERVSFKDYIEEHYHARLEAIAQGDLAGKIFRKYYMNSLYGKFGADPSNYAEYVIATTDTVQYWNSKGYREYQPWGEGKWLYERPPTLDDLKDMDGHWRYYNAATSASITGYQRAFLFREMCKTSGLIYLDTDGLMARDVSKLTFGKELGQWKDEGSFDRYAIAGKKMYAIHKEGMSLEYDPKVKDEKDRSWKLACKGVAFHELQDGPDRIATLATGGEIEYFPQVPTYSVSRQQPLFINRSIRKTMKDIRIAPNPKPESLHDELLEIAPHLYLV